MNPNYVINDPLAEIYNEDFWLINKVSPMCNLQYTKIKLKQYASKICYALLSDVAASSNFKFNVLIVDVPMLKYSHEDSSGLKLTVTLQSENDAKSKSKEMYVAILLSWGVCVQVENGIHLPYMLERGDPKVGAVVKTTMQKVFDCSIFQYNFNQLELLKFMYDCVENDTSRHSEPFVLTFRTPQVNFKNKLTVTFEVGDVHIIMNSLTDNVDNQYELITQAYCILQNQMLQMTSIDVFVHDLYQVSLPKVAIKNVGYVKMKAPEMINSVFTTLNEITNIPNNLTCGYEQI